MKLTEFKLVLLSISLLAKLTLASASTNLSLAPEQLGNAGRKFLFMENKGQVLDQHGHPQPDILFLGRDGGMKIALTGTGIHYQFERTASASTSADPTDTNDGNLSAATKAPKAAPVETYRLDMQLIGANPHPEVVREGLNSYFENYYNVASSPEGILGVRAYERVTMKDVYPGIDWVIYTKDGTMKYDFVVHPGADPAQIQMKYAGAVELLIQADGSVTAKTPFGELTEQAPKVFSGTKEVASRFELEEGILSFSTENYDPTLPLTIDPALIWATYYGGSQDEYGTSTMIDASSNVYLAGYTQSSNQIASGGHQNTIAGMWDAFLVKFDAAGVRQWGTYYGGALNDYANAVAVDLSGNVFLAGATESTSGNASGGRSIRPSSTPARRGRSGCVCTVVPPGATRSGTWATISSSSRTVAFVSEGASNPAPSTRSVSSTGSPTTGLWDLGGSPRIARLRTPTSESRPRSATTSWVSSGTRAAAAPSMSRFQVRRSQSDTTQSVRRPRGGEDATSAIAEARSAVPGSAERVSSSAASLFPSPRAAR